VCDKSIKNLKKKHDKRVEIEKKKLKQQKLLT